ncbi:MAG: SDR family NAD(P)-dependent oxidoreductase [Armatimonadota bacterium]
MDIKGRTVIVTGSGSGIGRALAVEFSANGANVVCCGRREAPLRETVALIEASGGTALAIPADVTDPQQVDRLVSQAIERFGSIDVLFNNAGSFNAIGAFWEVDPDVWWNDVMINIRSVQLCSRAVLPHMMARNVGIIINMNGGGALGPLPGGSGYGSSRAAVLRMTDTLAQELAIADSDVQVYALGPGFVRTEMTELQVTTEGGRKWLPGSGQAFDEGADRPAEDCARATIQLIRYACKELSGRIFDVDTDFEAMAHQGAEIAAADSYTMRFHV